MKIAAFDIEGVLYNGKANEKDGLLDFSNIVARALAAVEISKWAMEGWVPSIVSNLPVDDDNMILVEMWLSKNNIGYSNLLLGVTSYTDALKWINADFYVTSKPKEVLVAIAMNKKLRLYVIRTTLNKDFEKYLGTYVHGDLLDRIKFVDTFTDITKMENEK